jgi:hypothetical protein
MTTSSVKIRMYRQGLGDCFLLTFSRPDGSHYYVMIDCGVVMGGDPSRVVAAATDILEVTNQHLNLVVGTHIHWDHISGFCQARNVFDQFVAIDNIWLPWTENKANRAAFELANQRAAKVNALRTALARMSAAGMAESSQDIQSVLDFMGPDTGAGGALAAAGAAGCGSDDAMEYLRTRRGATVQYCTPGTDPVRTLEGVPDVRVYVLAPPTDPKFLGKIDPSRKNPETYTEPGAPAAAAAAALASVTDSFLAAVSEAGGPHFGPLKETTHPFDQYYRITEQEARQDEFFRQYYGFAGQVESSEGEEWRRIDGDWLNLTGELALNLDNDVNNTSLVLAFELGEPGRGKVLLFAADAQVGNWLSWTGTNLSWTFPSSGQPAGNLVTVTPENLLRRAVFYKVGHHGSHNATLANKGLDLMTDDGLVAFIPVNHAQAVKKRWPGMPFQPMLDVLMSHTRGRIVCIDDSPPPRLKPSTNISDADWQAFTDNLVETDDYYEYTITW